MDDWLRERVNRSGWRFARLARLAIAFAAKEKATSTSKITFREPKISTTIFENAIFNFANAILPTAMAIRTRDVAFATLQHAIAIIERRAK